MDIGATKRNFNFPKKHRMPFYFVSASDGTNVVKVALMLFSILLWLIVAPGSFHFSFPKLRIHVFRKKKKDGIRIVNVGSHPDRFGMRRNMMCKGTRKLYMKVNNFRLNEFIKYYIYNVLI